MIRQIFAAACAAVALTGCGVFGDANPRSPITIAETPRPAPIAPSSPPLAPADPDDIEIPQLGVRSTLIPLGLTPNGELRTPDVKRPEQAGYYRQGRNGVLPGAIGPALIAAHRDGAGRKGAFHRLGELRDGDTFHVDLKDRTRLTFTVYRVLHIDKGSFPTGEVFQDTLGPEARLVTCSGEFLGGRTGYKDNTIIFAKWTKSTKM